jgi:lysine N6-hydroxylase
MKRQNCTICFLKKSAVRLACRYATSQYGLASSIHGGFGVDGRSDQSVEFLNYLKSQQRLYKFYFLEQPHIPRREYNHYCQWVADQLGHIQYQSTVKAIYAKSEGFEVVVEQGGRFIRYLCRNLVIGSGNQPYLPECLRKLQQQVPEKCIHSAEYLTHKKASSKAMS